MKKLKRFIVLGAFVVPGTALAGEGAFGWLYTLDLQPKGTWEIEQKLDLNTGQAPGGRYNLWKSKTGLEYGVTNDFQLTGYVNAYSVNASKNYTNCEDGSARCTSGWGVPGSKSELNSYSKTSVDGVSLEGIWRITNPVVDPVGVGIYLEGTTGSYADAIEARLLLQSNFLDDRLILAANIVGEIEKYKWNDEPMKESIVDVLLGVSYRFAPKWFAGIEGRVHNDFSGYGFQQRTQFANFVGPNIHYASKDWWFTAAWRYQIGGQCWAPGDADCMGGKVADSHGVNNFIVKVGFPL